MPRRARVLLLLPVALAFGAWTATWSRQPQIADIVIWNANVLTVDGSFSRAQAVAVRDGAFLAVGDNEQVRIHVGPSTRLIDTGGRTIVPGLIETHVHATGAARGEAVSEFGQLHSIRDMRDWVRARATEVPPGTWIQLPRVDATRIREGRIPTREELDAVAPKHPAVYTWEYGSLTHTQVLNSLGIKIAGLTADTPAPPGGRIERRPNGELTGVVENGLSLLDRSIPSRTPTPTEYLDALAQLMTRHSQVGITSISERSSGPDDYGDFQQLRTERRLPIRVTLTTRINPNGTVADAERVIRGLPYKFGDGDDWLKVGPLKIGVDGGTMYGTSYMRPPYPETSFKLYRNTDPDYRGSFRPGITAEGLMNSIGTGHRLGWPMSMHVTGDAGVDTVLGAVEAANADSSILGRRFTLIHAYFPNTEAATRAVRLGVVVDTQPAWYYKDGDSLSTALGAKRLEAFMGLQVWASCRRHSCTERGPHAGL